MSVSLPTAGVYLQDVEERRETEGVLVVHIVRSSECDYSEKNCCFGADNLSGSYLKSRGSENDGRWFPLTLSPTNNSSFQNFSHRASHNIRTTDSTY